jgi:UDP-N-acetylmuramate dehydrogenase
MKIQKNISLLPYNTFGLEAFAANFCEVSTEKELQQVLKNTKETPLILGGGSNLLLTQDIAGLVIKNSIRGLEIARDFKHKVWVSIGGGEVWHDFVLWCVRNNWGGVENLSLIPGTVGASPVQNIGAYGVEIKDTFVGLYAIHLKTGKKQYFNKKQCAFGYRDSIFKHEAKSKYCITSVIFSLTKGKHTLNLSYGDLTKTLEADNITQPNIADVSNAVIKIRSSKLPDPKKIGNCGSFFKNPEISLADFTPIEEKFPNIISYALPADMVKIPAGWLIEQCGWKGKRVGNMGCYEKQALVLVNHGGAKGQEVKQLAMDIIGSVWDKFGIRIEAEVNII